jgi:stage IV sporulation protein FB
MRFANGYLEVGRIRGATIRIHWTMPLGCWLLTRFAFVPVAWLCIALLIFLHELGHAVVVWACHRRVTGIDLLPVGGLCRWEGQPVTPLQRACIAFGGAWAQMVLLAAVMLITLVAGRPEQSWSHQAYQVFVSTNLFIMGFNLLPLAPLDGAEAWQVFPLGFAKLKAWWRGRNNERNRKATIKKRLEAWDEQAKNAGTDRQAAELIGRIVRDTQAKAPSKNDSLLN